MGEWLFRLLYGRRAARFAGLPGPTPSFPLGTAGDFLGPRKPWEVCADYATKYGGATLVWLGGTPAVVLNDPDLIGAVLDADAGSYYKAAPHDALEPVITSDCLFITNGDPWRAMRANTPINRLADPAWHGRQFPRLDRLVRERAAEFARQPGPVNLIDRLRRLTYDAFSLVVWGRLQGDESYARFLEMATVGSGRLTELPLLQKVPPLDPRFYLARDPWYADFRAQLDAAFDRPDAAPESLIRDVARQGTTLTREQLLVTMTAGTFFGGGFSIPSGIATTLYCLAKNPDAAAHVAAGSDDCGDGSRVDHALREAMRVLPPVPLYFRNVLKDRPARLGGHDLPADTTLFVTNWHLQRDPAHWPDPERYAPARWADGGTERDPFGGGHYFPFGRGPRACVGQGFALFFMRLALAAILSEWAVEFDPAAAYKQGFFFGVMHPEGLTATFRPRGSSRSRIGASG